MIFNSLYKTLLRNKMSLKSIIHNDNKFLKDKTTNSYLRHVDDTTYYVLVCSTPADNCKGFTDIKMINNILDTEEDYEFEEHLVNYEHLVYEIEYLDYKPCSNDAGENFIAFDLKKYLNVFNPELHYKITKICEKNNDKPVTWRS